MQTRKLVLCGLLIAIGVLTAHLIYIPVGVAKCFPVQHTVNVLAAVLLGPEYAVAVAFVISSLRNMLGTGSLLAFPGSMVGAFLAGIAYSHFKSYAAALGGEVIGTGLLGALAAWVIAAAVLGSKAGAFFLVPPFMISTTGGALIAYFILRSGVLKGFK